MLYLRLVCWIFVWWLKFEILTVAVMFTGSDLDHFPFNFKNHYSEQSPINIIKKTVIKVHLPHLHCHYLHPFNTAIAELTNSGYTIVVKLTNNTLDVPTVVGGPLFGKKYLFEQLHFHWGPDINGSEHEINGEKYAMEVHIVHYNNEYGSYKNAKNYRDGVCVVGVFGKISPKCNPEITHFIRDLKLLKNLNSKIVRDFRYEFSWIKNIALKQHYYTYHGSLTTNTLAECVIWIIFTNTFTISKKQLSKFRKLHSTKGYVIKTNDRELQPSNNRPVYYVKC